MVGKGDVNLVVGSMMIESEFRGELFSHAIIMEARPDYGGANVGAFEGAYEMVSSLYI